jgi:hypothetical protein
MHVGPSLKQRRCDARFLTIDRSPKRRITNAVASLDIGAAVQQRVADLDVASSSRHVQWRTAFDSIASIHVRACLNQGFYHTAASRHGFIGQAVQRGVPPSIFGTRIRTQAQEQLDACQVARSRCSM